MNYLRKVLKDLLQIVVDKLHGKKIDIIATVGYAIITICAGYVLWMIAWTATSDAPIVPSKIPPFLYSMLIATPMILYFMTLAGDYYKKSSRRIQIFVFSVTCTCIFSTGYVIQIVNLGFVSWLSNIKNIDVIPPSLLVGNIRLVTFIFPLLIVLPVASLILQMLKDKKVRKDIRELEVEPLLATVHKMDETTIDITICEDAETGEDCIVPEKKTYEHTFLQGGTGSGKTATYIRPVVAQLFDKKSFLRECQKRLAHEALGEGLAVLTQPITNHWFNKYFTMDFIKPKEGKEKEFKEKFKEHIVGVRDKNSLVYNNSIQGGTVELNALQGDDKYEIKVTVLDNAGLELAENSCTVIKDVTSKTLSLGGKYKDIIITTINEMAQSEEAKIESILNKEAVIEENQEKLYINLPRLDSGMTYSVKVNEKGSGKIVYKGVGLCVVAPDGGLPSDTVKIGDEYGVKVHKIDPAMSEINKGVIAKFNPLKGGRADKVGDIISSILVSMDNPKGDSKSNPFFTNASVRAVRNLVILLKEMYPEKNNGHDPTLRDVLDCLNNFNSVIPYVEAMKRDEAKKNKWGSVIQYFETSFYPPPTDDKGKAIVGGSIGSQRKKTEESISGIINQLDNFVTREEVAYILCDRENSLDLYSVIENGECLAISTRQTELGERLGKAFALFFILSIQNVVLSRYSEDENPEIPFHLIIDEFPFYINDNTKVFFTFARKYKCAVTVAIQNMAQLREVSDVFRETIFTNTDTKLLLPKSNVEDRQYWAEFFGTYQSFEMQTGVNTSSIFSDSPKYSEQRRGTLQDVNNVTEQEINELNFKEALYTYTDKKGRTRVGKGNTDFLKIDPKSKTPIGNFNFESYNPKKYDIQEEMQNIEPFEKSSKPLENQKNFDDDEVLIVDYPAEKINNSNEGNLSEAKKQATNNENVSYQLDSDMLELSKIAGMGMDLSAIASTLTLDVEEASPKQSNDKDLTTIKTVTLDNTEAVNSIDEVAVMKEVELRADINYGNLNWVDDAINKPEVEKSKQQNENTTGIVEENEMTVEEMVNIDFSKIEFDIEGEQNGKPKK